MSITDELRRYVLMNKDMWGMNQCAEHIETIADRIDERHAEELERMWDEAEGADLKAFEATHVKLPVDADGVPIRMGDEMELTDEAARRWDGDKHFGKVMGLELTVDGWTVEGDPATDLRHVKPDSWERIIEDACDMASRCCDDDAGKAELVERCKKLAGEAE